MSVEINDEQLRNALDHIEAEGFGDDVDSDNIVQQAAMARLDSLTFTQEALAHAFWHVELARDDLGQVELDATQRECLEHHIDSASHWLQEIANTHNWDPIVLMGDCIASKDARRAAIEVLLNDGMPDGASIRVEDWAGCDEDWEDPIYVTARDTNEQREYHDAICDLSIGSIKEQAEFLIEQLTHG